MSTASEIVRAGLSDRRIPLAGTRITAERCGWEPHGHRPVRHVRVERFEQLDRDICRVASREVRCRLIQGRIVAVMMKRKYWRPLGFSRVDDYTTERLGVHARTVEEEARVTTALDGLPAIRKAYESDAIGWTHARLLAGVAVAETEQGWLQVALGSTTRQLAPLVKGLRRGACAPGHEQRPDACASDETAVSDPDACASDETAASDPDACASDARNAAAAQRPDACASPTSDEPEDPLVLFDITCTRKGRQLFRALRDLTSRVCGIDVPVSKVAEAVAAEAITWSKWEAPLAEPMPRRTVRETREASIRTFEALHGTAEGYEWLAPPAPDESIDAELEALLVGLDDADAFEVDARLRTVRAAAQRIDGEIGALLRTMADSKIHQAFGFADIRLYAEARLGICGSKAQALIGLDRDCARRSPALMQAYREGRVTWLAATALRQVISRQYENEWVERAARATFRRLESDISWALDRADDENGKPCQPPPPETLDTIADTFGRIDEADVQMRARSDIDRDASSRQVDARIAILLPQSIAMLLDDAIEGCRNLYEPRWRAFERILAHAYLTWTSLPQHPSPIFTRDGYRCTTPGCRCRGPLHRHHIRYRSDGGGEFHDNLTAVCNDHHIAYIHLGYIRVHGAAPGGVIWELGCRPGQEPLMRLLGDFYMKK